MISHNKRLTVGDMHFTANGTDGVGLQMQENLGELHNLGIRAFPIGADVDGGPPLLDYHSDAVSELRQLILSSRAVQGLETTLISTILTRATVIQHWLEKYFDAHKINALHVRNINSLPMLNLPAAMAIKNLANDPCNTTRIVLHHHDLYWEGPAAKDFTTPYSGIQQLAEGMIQLNHDTPHICINSLAAAQLKERYGIEAEVIPDGFNFDRQIPEVDDDLFRADFGFKPNDLLVGMMTRVRINKNIEGAIDFVKSLQGNRTLLEKTSKGVGRKHRHFNADSRIILVLTQSKDLDPVYFSQVKTYAQKAGVNLAFIGDRVVSDSQYRHEPGTYPFYGTYQPMDLIVYPPKHEGFGNQAIEAAWAKKLLIMTEYPVAVVDILPHIPHLISLGSPERPDYSEAALKAIYALTNHEAEELWTQENFVAFRRLCDIKLITPRYINLYNRAIIQPLKPKTAQLYSAVS